MFFRLAYQDEAVTAREKSEAEWGEKERTHTTATLALKQENADLIKKFQEVSLAASATRSSYAAKLHKLDECLHVQQNHMREINIRASEIEVEKFCAESRQTEIAAELEAANYDLGQVQAEYDSLKALTLTYPNTDVDLLCVVNHRNTSLQVI